MTYRCDEGHELEGNEVRTCGASGVLSGEAAVCRAVECVKPAEVISNGRMLGSSFTFSSIVSYVCDEGYRLSGASQRLCQANGEWDQPIPTCQVVQCPRATIVNGSPSTFTRDFGTVVRFTCRSRHRLEGPEERTCMADGTWSGDDPVCVKIICPPPPSLSNGASRQVDDTTLNFSCNEGYRLDGPDSSTCNERGVWEPSAPSCVLITCPDISSVRLLNGVVIRSQNFGNYGSQVQYRCNSGYTLSGASRRQCLETGQWEGEAPVCQIITCPRPQQLNNGLVRWDGLSFGSAATYQCSEGYQQDGATRRECQADGTWEGESPTCNIVTCPETGGTFENGLAAVLSSNYGGQVTYSCFPGFMLQGEARLNCLASGEWSGQEPRCVPMKCPDPPPVENGRVVGEDVMIGRSVMYRCDEGYRPVGSTVLVCLPNLMWSGLAPVCQPVTCPELPPVQFGTADSSSRQYGDEVLFLCDSGYEMIGPSGVLCLADGTWDDDPPECAPVSCGLPPMVDHAMPDLVNGTLFPAHITYVCDTGYRANGSGAASCLAEGSWSQPSLACEVMTCTEIMASYFPGGTVIGGDFTYGAVVSFSCSEGYRLQGDSSITCQASGYWGGEIPVCDLVTCSEPDSISHGSVTAAGYDFNNTATYSCDEGYELNGQAVATCTGSGAWSSEERECVLVQCQSLPDIIPNGRLVDSKPSYVYQDEVEYQCHFGYELIGTGRLTCTAQGLFHPSQLPSCAKVQCPPPDTPPEGTVQVIDDTLHYGCLPGYELVGEPQRRCLETGQWEGLAPVCIPIVCPPPPFLSYGFYQGDDFQFGRSVAYTCDPGFTLRGDAVRTCLSDRTWSGVEPSCERVSCGPPRPVEFGTVLGEDFFFNDTVSYECQLGYTLAGPPERTCLYTGEWAGEEPYCEQITCQQPPDIVNATHDADTDGTRFPFGSLVMYTCDIGHVMSGPSSILCQEDGAWSGPFPTCPPVTCPSVPAPEHGHVSGEDLSFGGELTFTCERGYRLEGEEDMLVCAEDGRWDGEVPQCLQVQCAPPSVDNGMVRLEGGPGMLDFVVVVLERVVVVMVS